MSRSLAAPLLLAAALLAGPGQAQPERMAALVRRYPAAEAHQGVAVDARHFYPVANSQMGKNDKASGRKVGGWSGDPAQFAHLNSCAIIGRELICANSNYPAIPMMSWVEVFDPVRMTHVRSIPLGPQSGSLTWVDRKDGSWWAGFANYDGRGGAPGRDHRFTQLVKFDDRWRALQSWLFPDDVLQRMAPRSASGGAFGPDGKLYVTGHDRAELYVLDVPGAGERLTHLATIGLPFEGQAFSFDHSQPRVLFGIAREGSQVVSARLPPPQISRGTFKLDSKFLD